MIILKRSKDKQFFFIVRALNGKTIGVSETYRSKANAIKGVRALRRSLTQMEDQTMKPSTKPKRARLAIG